MNNGQMNKFRADISTCMSENHALWHKSMQRENINRESTFYVQTHYRETEIFQYTNFNFTSFSRRKERICKRRSAMLPWHKFHYTPHLTRKYKFSKYAED